MEHDGNNLSMVRGDSERIHFTLYDKSKNRLLKDTDVVEFTVRKRATSDERLIHKSVIPRNGVALIKILPEDTSNLKFRDYVYDIQLTEKSGAVTTLVKCATFSIEKEVTY